MTGAAVQNVQSSGLLLRHLLLRREAVVKLWRVGSHSAGAV